jgi:hypothetical protein
MKDNQIVYIEKKPKENNLMRVGKDKTQNEGLDASGHFQTLLLHFL